MPHHIIFVHGIGGAELKVADVFKANIEKETVHMGVKVYSFFWKGLVSKKEEQIKKKLGGVPKSELLFSINLRESIETYLMLRLRKYMIGYLGDAVFYLSESSGKVKSQLEKALFHIAKKDKNARISIVAHSLGSVIAFDMLCDKSFRKLMGKNKLVIENFFTVGSPLALFSLRPHTATNPALPITGSWINIYDKRDILASPLSAFFEQCRDCQVRVHNSNPLTAHINYFSDTVVLNEILRTLL